MTRIPPEFVQSHVINDETCEVGMAMITPEGIGQLTSIALGGSQGNSVAITLYGAKEGSAFTFDQVRKAGTKEFFFNAHGFGKTAWWAFGLIQLLCIALCCFVPFNTEDGGWLGIAFAVLVESALVTWTYANYILKVR